jgi:Common central domain of tyrosinase
MKRREFVRLSVAVGLGPWLGEMAFAQTTAGVVRIRKSATSPAAAQDIEALRKGVGLMMANTTATNYGSWMYWANSHGTTGSVPPTMAKIWNQCQHGTDQFLTWHRMYLFFFESLLRELSQVDTFALPYWDWYASSAIPDAYVNPTTASGDKNDLYLADRKYKQRTLVQDALTKSTFFPFNQSLESNPHGTVHVMVGGQMGSITTAARDPLFWAHHTNVDRMWEVWLSADPTRKNPDNAEWRNTEFAFDVSGEKNKKVSDILNAERQLMYKYDSVAPAGGQDLAPLRPARAFAVPLASN